jgi:hypothetical protein
VYDSRQDTNLHIHKVQANLRAVRENLGFRAEHHDASKLKPPEKPIFDAFTPKLSSVTYGSDEYRAMLAEMRPAIEHHNANNSHHPEHYPDGVNGMSLLDVIEMLADWKAASERHADGDIRKSLEINAKRFNLEPQLVAILKNTLGELGW